MLRSALQSGFVTKVIALRLLAGLLGVCVMALLPAAAQASNLFTLGSKDETTGPIVTESNGTGYIAWDQAPPKASEPEVVLFCKIPRGGTCTTPVTLPLPSGSYEGIVQPFPVLGSTAGVVYVVGPRYIKDEDTVIWTSTDGGEIFSPPKKVPTNTLDKGNIGDVLLDPNTPVVSPGDDYFGIVGNNVGLGFGFTANEVVSGTTAFTFEHPGNGGVASSTLGYATHTIEDSFTKKSIYPEVVAYYNLSSPTEVFFYRYFAKGGNVDGEEKGWEGPYKVSDGYVPRLAGGPAGLFMLSTDVAHGEPTEAQPSAVDVRKFNETTRTFEEPPVTLEDIPTSAGTLFNSGDIYENPETGVLYVVQPVIDGEGEYVMRLWESSDGGKTFHGERNIATIGFGYSGIPRLAVAADGQGWLTFNDYAGVEVANLNALPTPVPISSKSTTPTPTPTPPVSSLTIPNQTDDVNGKGDLSISVDCTGAKCTGNLTLVAKYKKTTGKGKKKKTKTIVLTIGTASFNSLDLGVDTISLKLNSKGQSLLAIDGYKLSSTASATYLSGSVFKTATGTLKLKGHKPSKKGVIKAIKL